MAPAERDGGPVRALRREASYRLVLTYLDPSAASGKATADSDVVDVRFVDVVDGERVVQAVEFESEDPAFAGTMVEIVAVDVPDGIAAIDHAEGLASSLVNLARHLGG